MSKYDSQYSIAFPAYQREDCVIWKADRATHRTRFGRQRLSPGKPLIFSNAYADRFGPGKLPEKLNDVHFRGFNMIVREWVKDYLAQFEINNLQLYPAVFIDISGKYHDGYWLLNIFEGLDCWDRSASDYRDEDVDPDDEDAEIHAPTLLRYSLNAQILDRIPEEQRLIFRMGGTDCPRVFIHNKVRQFLDGRSAEGTRMFTVADYVLGMEIRP